jgi:fucose permease
MAEKTPEKEAKETSKFEKFVDEEREKNNDDVQHPEGQEEYKEDPYRYVVLFLFILTLVSNFPLMISLQPVMKSLIFLFEIGSFEIYLISNLFVFGDIIFSFPAMYIIGKLGLKKGMSIGLLLTVVSSLLRLFLTSYFPLLYVGNMIGSFGMQLVLSNLAKIVTLWFKDENRPMVFASMAAIYAIGPIFALSLPSFFVDEDFSSREKKISQINNILYTILGVNIVVCIIFVIFFRNEPKYHVEKASKEPPQPFWPSIKALFFNRNYRVFSIAFSYLASSFMLFNIFSHYILSPFGLTQQNISMVSMLMGM